MSNHRLSADSQPSIAINGVPVAIWPGLLRQHWRASALGKGFNLIARVQDRYHFALECHHCGQLSQAKLFVVMNNQPLCHPCLLTSRQAHAARAGLQFLRRDPNDRHYAFYQILSCGHEVKRQLELIERAANGQNGLRCEICHNAKERAEAFGRGWKLIGPDPDRNPNYRRYQHANGCGHVQRVARVNMQTGRFSCASCGGLWPAEPSHLYLMSFTLKSGAEVVKLGFSRDPGSRLRHQLCRNPRQPCALLQVVPLLSGRDAICIEKSLHGYLKQSFPKSVVAPSLYAAEIKVKSEIYAASLLSEMQQLLNFVARIYVPKTSAEEGCGFEN